MQLTLKHYDISATIQTTDEITLNEIMNQVNALLLSATFSQGQINDWIIQKANELLVYKKN